MDKAELLQQLQVAFDKAEQETADHFNGQTCSMRTKDGDDTCPICYFRQRVKAHLGLAADGQMFTISEKHKQPQSILYGDNQYFHCLQCGNHQFQYGGQIEHEAIHDGGELDGEPYYWYSDLYRCNGCHVIVELSEHNLPNYKGPVKADA